MGLLLDIISTLPDEKQDLLLGWLTKTGLILHLPVFKMLLNSMVFFGAELSEVKYAFSRATNAQESLINSLRYSAVKMASSADEAEKDGNKESAAFYYHKAALYNLMGNLFVQDDASYIKNYELAMPYFDLYRKKTSPPIEKVKLPFDTGELYAHLRIPENASMPLPVVIIVQGNDTVKEFTIPLEKFALQRGIATLSIDPPGWGESGLSGNRLRTRRDIQKCIHQCVDYLQSRNEFRPECIGILGFSFGSLIALYCAGVEPRIKAVATVGAPFHGTLNKLWRKRPIMQKRAGNRYTGHHTIEERDQWMESFNFPEVFMQIQCPVLLNHGSKDGFYPLKDIYLLADSIKGKTEVNLIEGGDHMCTQFLSGWLVDDMMKWLSDHLI